MWKLKLEKDVFSYTCSLDDFNVKKKDVANKKYMFLKSIYKIHFERRVDTQKKIIGTVYLFAFDISTPNHSIYEKAVTRRKREFLKLHLRR